MPEDTRRVETVGVIGACVCLLVSLFMAGCGSSAPPPEPVTLTFSFPEADAATYEQMATAFKAEQPYITIELRPKPSEILAGLTEVDDSDVILTSQFAIAWLQSQGRVLDLTPFLEGDVEIDQDDFYPGTIGLFTVDGQVWAVPAAVDMMVMYYNPDLFDRYGAAYPRVGWNWDDFLAAAAAVRDVEAGVFGYGPNYEMFDPMLFMYQHGGRIFDSLENPTRTTFNEPTNVEALEWYFRLMFDFDVAPTPEQARAAFGGRGSIYEGIWAEKVAMWTGFLSQRGGLSDPPEWPFAWAVAPLPTGRRAASMALVDAYFVSAETAHRDAAWQWVSFLSQQVPPRLAPVRRSVAESSAYEQQVGAEIAAVTQASMETALLLSPRLIAFENALEVLQNAFEEIAAGRMTPVEALDWAQQQFE